MDSSRKQMDNAQIRTQPDTHPHTLGWTSTARANIFVDFISKSHYQMVSLRWDDDLLGKGGRGGSTCVGASVCAKDLLTHTDARLWMQ